MTQIPTQEKKKLIIFLSLFTVFAVGFSIFYIKHGISDPFNKMAEGRTESLEKQELEELVAMKTKDSDGDGLVDYDELYLYQTSPYLTDSDSDGFDDKTEIDSGNDPNCLAGHVCEQEREETGVAEEILVKDIGDISPAEIRELLKETGASEEMLSQVDDDTLINLYQETMVETGIDLSEQVEEGVNDFSNLLENEEITSLDQLTNLSVEDIRELLLAAGAEAEELAKISDEELQIIYLESLAEQQSSVDQNNVN